MLRQARAFSRWSAQRQASTTSQATDAAASTASKSREAASNATSKASQGLSRVTSTAGPALSGAAQRVSSILGGIGGRTGRLISLVECKFSKDAHTKFSQGFILLLTIVGHDGQRTLSQSTMSNFLYSYIKGTYEQVND